MTPARVRSRCVAPGCHQGVAVGTTVCDDHLYGRLPWWQKRQPGARRQSGSTTVVRSWHIVPPRVRQRYVPLGVTPRMLDSWRANYWLGSRGKGQGHPYPWDDPEVDAQIRWLGELHRAGHELTDDDAEAGFALRAAGTEFAVKIGGHWRPATADDIGWLCTHSKPFTAARVPALALASPGDLDHSPRPGLGDACGGTVARPPQHSHDCVPTGRAAPTSTITGRSC